MIAGVREFTGRPVRIGHPGRERVISSFHFEGSGVPRNADPLLRALAREAMGELRSGVRAKVGPQIYTVDRIEAGGVPVIRLAHAESFEKTDNGVFFQLVHAENTGTLYLRVRTPDYFGLLQEVTYAAIESGLEIDKVGTRHERLSGSSQVELSCRFKEGETRLAGEIFGRFAEVMSGRIQKYNSIGTEGERVLFTYHNLISACGRFLNTFPCLTGLPALNAKAVEAALQANPQLAVSMIKYLRIKFDQHFAHYYGLRKSDLRSLRTKIEHDLAEVTNADQRLALGRVYQFILAVEKTNAFDQRRNPEVVVFKLNSSAIQKIADHFKITYPTDITYVYSPRTGSYAIGARFGGEVSKGGDRYYLTTAAAGRLSYDTISRLALEDALRLAHAQETKNLLWGCYVNGLKTVLVAAPPIGESADLKEVQNALTMVRGSRAYAIIKDAWLELKGGEDLDGKVAKVLAGNDQPETRELLFELIQLENLVNLSLGEYYLKNLGDKRPGPDMNMAPSHMEFLTVVAKHLGVPHWASVYTGKSAEFGGFPHRKLKVTGRGIFTNMVIAMKNLDLDPSRQEVTATVQGFGDVGSSMVHFLLTEKPDVKLTAISDLTGMIVCPQGLGAKPLIREELLRLVSEERTLEEFNRGLLVDGVELVGPERIGEIVTMPSTIFIPAAGSNVITEENVGAVLTSHELVVEAANIPFTVRAANNFDAQGGKRVPGDFANGGGVLTSTNEILALQILGPEGFKADYERLREDNRNMIIQTAETNSRYMWEQFRKVGGGVTFVDLVKKVTRNMTVVKSIVKISTLNSEDKAAYQLLFDAIFPSIVETIDRDEIIERLGPSIVKELIAAQLARKIIFGHDADWFEQIPAEKRDEVILAEAQKIIQTKVSGGVSGS
jgi:glutamate dehydrogenase/leucine dehydrogenase